MKALPCLLILITLFLSSCAAGPESIPAGESLIQYTERKLAYRILDHRTQAAGGEIPPWVTRYMEQGIPGLEAMAGYEDRYLFVEVNSGTNLKALEQWRSGFSVSQDFAQMVSSRVRSRLIDAAGNPDRIYGRYFEGLIKTISDSNYSGVRRETDFWLFKRYFAEDGETIDREVYEYYILVSINKSILEEQIDLILRQVQIQTDSTREQTAAIERLRENFYEGF